jgi:hypothetical protein
MRTKTSTWYECKIRYEKTTETGEQKKVSELYAVDALSFTEAESNIIKEMSDFIQGVFEVKGIKEAPYGEIFFSDNTSDDKWFKVKLCFITLDEKTEKVKKSNVLYLVQANNIKNAISNVEAVMSKTMIEYTIKSVTETQIFDVYEQIK